VEPARVSSPQVDLTRYGLDKTPSLLILRCLGATRSARRERRYRRAPPLAGPRSSPSLPVALLLPLLSFSAFAQLSNKRLSLFWCELIIQKVSIIINHQHQARTPRVSGPQLLIRHWWCVVLLKRHSRIAVVESIQKVSTDTKSKHQYWPMEGHYWVPSLFSKRSNQALRPGPLSKPLSN